MNEMITDIGIDLGTATVIIYVKGKGIVLKEPSVVAYDTRSGKMLCVGREAYAMIGRTPDRIRAVKPLDQGVISDNELCEKILQHFLKKVYQNALLKPRVALCVPSAITDVESRAVVDAAVKAGAARSISLRSRWRRRSARKLIFPSRRAIWCWTSAAVRRISLCCP